MEKTISPSQEPITEGQIGKIAELLTAALRKSKGNLPSDLVQKALEQPGKVLSVELQKIVSRYVHAVSGMIYRMVKVDRILPTLRAINKASKNVGCSEETMNHLPLNDGPEEVEIILFKGSPSLHYSDLGKEYELRGLKPVDPASLAAFIEVNELSVYGYPIITYWKGENHKIYFMVFGKDSIVVDPHAFDLLFVPPNPLDTICWYAGVRN